MRDPDPARPDVHAQVTRLILDQLAAGVRPWTQPWTAGGPALRPRRVTGEPYRGVNVVLLWTAAAARGYAAPTWMTFRQALALGGHVRRGEHGATVVYAGRRAPAAEPDDDPGPPRRGTPFLKAYVVFNVAQVDGLPEAFGAPPAPSPAARRILGAEGFFAALGADIRQGGDVACYVPDADRVQIPPLAAFADTEAYYATLAHECVHWSGHPSRLARDLRGRFGEAAYAREELVAELGAAFLCADLGLALTPREDHAAYIADWLTVLQGDARFVVAAAAHAQRACDFLHGLQPPAAGEAV